MDWGTILTTAGTSAVVSALVTGFVARRNVERAIQIENITKERAKWRDKIREQALAVRKAAVDLKSVELKNLRLTLSLNLNPTDTEDRAILAVVDKLAKSQKASEEDILQFSDRVALLLKHDWDRAKCEANREEPPRRMTYKQFQKVHTEG